MNEEISAYLNSQRIAVLTVLLPDGQPHASSIHFANDEDFNFFFQTSADSRKATDLTTTPRKAALVVGFDESHMVTLQLEGEVRLIKPEEVEHYNNIYLGKFQMKVEKEEDATTARLIFTPTWWRYTDWTKPEGRLVLTNKDLSN